MKWNWALMCRPAAMRRETTADRIHELRSALEHFKSFAEAADANQGNSNVIALNRGVHGGGKCAFSRHDLVFENLFVL